MKYLIIILLILVGGANFGSIIRAIESKSYWLAGLNVMVFIMLAAQMVDLLVR